jgi:putative tricarboxylic transport membrane protein
MRLASGAERITAVAMLAICAGLLIAGYDLRYWDGFAPASGFAPVWIAIAGIVLALLLFFQVGAAAGTDDASHRPDRAELSRVLLTTTALWIFLAITPFTGMLLAALALMLFMLIVVLERPLLASLLTAVFTTLLVYAIFILWLRVRLPRGVFGF